MIDLEAEFEKHEDEFNRFENVEKPAHPCPDVCAFLLLGRLVPWERGQDMISYATHDEIALYVDCEILARSATSEDVLMLVRCGVRYDDDCLRMFV